MFLGVAPVVPEIPAVAALLGAAVLMLAWLMATGALTVWRRSLGALLTWLADTIDGVSFDIPHVTTIRPLAPLATALRALVSTVDHYLGEAVRWSEKGAATLFRFFTALNVWMAKEIASLATDTYHGLLAARAGVKAEVQAWSQAAFGYLIRRLTVAWHRIEGVTIPRVNARVDRVAQAERFHHRGEVVADAQINARVGITSRQLRRLSRRLSKVEKITAGLGAVALVSAALGRMKLGWLRCPALTRMGRRFGCGGFDFLESLLAVSFVPLLLTDACKIMREIEALAVRLQPEFAAFVLGVEGFLCGGPTSLPSAIEPSDLRRVDALPTGL